MRCEEAIIWLSIARVRAVKPRRCRSEELGRFRKIAATDAFYKGVTSSCRPKCAIKALRRRTTGLLDPWSAAKLFGRVCLARPAATPASASAVGRLQPRGGDAPRILPAIEQRRDGDRLLAGRIVDLGQARILDAVDRALKDSGHFPGADASGWTPDQMKALADFDPDVPAHSQTARMPMARPQDCVRAGRLRDLSLARFLLRRGLLGPSRIETRAHRRRCLKLHGLRGWNLEGLPGDQIAPLARTALRHRERAHRCPHGAALDDGLLDGAEHGVDRGARALCAALGGAGDGSDEICERHDIPPEVKDHFVITTTAAPTPRLHFGSQACRVPEVGFAKSRLCAY